MPVLAQPTMEVEFPDTASEPVLGLKVRASPVPLVSVYWHYEGPDDSGMGASAS